MGESDKELGRSSNFVYDYKRETNGVIFRHQLSAADRVAVVFGLKRRKGKTNLVERRQCQSHNSLVPRDLNSYQKHIAMRSSEVCSCLNQASHTHLPGIAMMAVGTYEKKSAWGIICLT